jgi:hypothetical protein
MGHFDGSDQRKMDGWMDASLLLLFSSCEGCEMINAKIVSIVYDLFMVCFLFSCCVQSKYE